MREKINIINLDLVDSTNSYAKSNIDFLFDKTVICANSQTEGRGRFTRKWVDLGKGNIFASIVLKPSSEFKNVYANITQYLSVILCRVFEKYGVKTQIKWPNDILINGAKISGILSETVMHGNNFKGLILGFGINLNSDTESLKNIKDKKATALNLEIKENFVDKNEFLNNLLEEFFDGYEEFLSKGFLMIKEDYIKRTNFLGTQISVKVFDEEITGLAKFINNSGELVLEKNDKETVLTMGDIL